VSTVTDIVAVVGEVNRLLDADPAALARREEILATKADLIGRIRAEQGQP